MLCNTAKYTKVYEIGPSSRMVREAALGRRGWVHEPTLYPPLLASSIYQLSSILRGTLVPNKIRGGRCALLWRQRSSDSTQLRYIDIPTSPSLDPLMWLQQTHGAHCPHFLPTGPLIMQMAQLDQTTSPWTWDHMMAYPPSFYTYDVLLTTPPPPSPMA